jgi:hypothetical protein
VTAGRGTCPQCRRADRYLPASCGGYCGETCAREAAAGWPPGRLPGPWLPSARPTQTRALVPVKAPGGVPVKVMRTVYRGTMFRRIEGRPGHEQDRCPHNHLKPGPAAECARAAARRLNRAELAAMG